MSSIRLQLRSGSLAQWATAESAGTGKLRKGEIGVGWIEVGGSITEVVMRIGPHATPTAFSACPVISRSPLTATGANVKIPVVDVTAKTNSLITLSGGQFVAVDDDPGEYPTSSDDGDGGSVIPQPSETPPAITSISLSRGTPEITVDHASTISLAHDAALGMVLRVIASGTPTPTVSAQIEGQSTITFLVGTVSGGMWSFPIALPSTAVGLRVITITATSTVQPSATVTREFTISRAAAPAPVSIAIDSLSIRDDSTNAVVTTAANGSGITLRANVTTSPAATTTTYQWRRGQSNIAGATSQTYALQSADDNSNVSCVVTVTRTVGADSATASASGVVAVGASESGWTSIAPANGAPGNGTSPLNSRLIYVATAAQGGNDTAAAAAKGRGYYIPSDPEIGPDPTNPVGPIVPYASLQAARSVELVDSPIWVLLRRGGSYDIDSYPAVILRGVDAANPAVCTAWGPESDARPIIGDIDGDGWDVGGDVFMYVSARHTRWMHLDIRCEARWHSGSAGYQTDILLEGCRFAKGLGGTDHASLGQVTLRRCVIVDNWNATSHNQGWFVSNFSGGGPPINVLIEECVFDRNGYKQDPNQPTTWTGNVVVAQDNSNALPVGTGVQPRRTFFDRNIYVSSGDGVNHVGITIRGSIFSRGGGGGTVQMRQGGVSERNLFIWNENAGFCANGAGGIYKDNVILHDDHFLPPGGFGQAFGVWNLDSQEASPRYVIDGNVAAHFHRITNGESGFYAREARTQTGTQLPGSVWIVNNAFLRDSGNYGVALYRDTMPNAVVGNNAVAAMNGKVTGEKTTASAAAGGAPYAIGSAAVGGNKYFSSSATPFGSDLTFAQWQASRANLDSASTFTSNFEAFKSAAGWTAPERDVVSYMQSIDPTFVPNENVFVDDDCTGAKQATRRKVWEVLTQYAEFPGAMTEVQAKLTARRYHAFITFIQRARLNRKGAWNPRYTAESVNNYIRGGFGKTAVGGPYVGTLADLGAYS